MSKDLKAVQQTQQIDVSDIDKHIANVQKQVAHLDAAYAEIIFLHCAFDMLRNVMTHHGITDRAKMKERLNGFWDAFIAEQAPETRQ